MNVPNIGQGPGSATTLPRGVAGGENGAGAIVRGSAPSDVSVPAISFTRLACFDVNGDGSIDTRSAAAGGDATLLVPTHGVDLPTYTRPANPMSSGRPVKDREPATTRSAPTSGTAAQSNHAVESYQRYGQTPPAAPAPVAAPAPAPSAPAPVPPATADEPAATANR